MKQSIDILIEGRDTRSKVTVDADVYGVWAAHQSREDVEVYRVTHTKYGLAVPYDFTSLSGAVSAAKEIAALRDNWDDAQAEEIQSSAKDIMAICCKRRGSKNLGRVGKYTPISEIQEK